MSLAGIPLWRDQAIELYHGTTDLFVPDILQAVDETRGTYLQDFGRGFYTTTRRDKAHDWAIRKARKQGGAPAVVLFDISRIDLAQLDCLFFVRGDASAVDFWSFVQYCRTIGRDHNRLHTPWYDLVVEPVAGTWRRQTIIPDTEQVSFHTSYAAAVLNASAKTRAI